MFSLEVLLVFFSHLLAQSSFCVNKSNIMYFTSSRAKSIRYLFSEPNITFSDEIQLSGTGGVFFFALFWLDRKQFGRHVDADFYFTRHTNIYEYIFVLDYANQPLLKSCHDHQPSGRGSLWCSFSL